ncbi:MAG: hypothetical protein HY898_03260 [Deltaproteobacteria bacterium]|nr:hypothetical protein [Deltaproteobacteria bacterium]
MRASYFQKALAGMGLAAALGPFVLSCASVVGIETLTAAPQDGAVASPSDSACPKAPPAAHPCAAPEECLYSCMSPHGQFAYAVCLSGTWNTTTLACGTVHCGMSVCETPGKLCMRRGKHEESCVPNPCRGPSMHADCACAAALCEGESPDCNSEETGAFVVTCDGG